MPVHEVKDKSGQTIGYRWGKSGKIYRSKEKAEQQGKAIYASGYGKKN